MLIDEKNRYLNGMILSAGANVFGMASSLVTIMIAARIISKEALGAYFLVLVLTQLATSLGDFGLRNTAIKTLSGMKVHEIQSTSHFFLSMSLFASVLAMFFVAASLQMFYRIWPYKEFVRYAWLSVPVTFFMINFQMSNSLLVGARKFGMLSLVNGGAEVLRAIISIACLLKGFGISGLLWSFILSRIVGIGVTWLAIPSQFGISFRNPLSSQLLRFSGWLYGCSIISVLTLRTADSMIANFMGPAALAIYSASMQLPKILQRMIESVRPVVLGYLSHRIQNGGVLVISEVRIVSGFLALGTTVLIFLARPLMSLLYPPSYLAGVDILRILAFWILVSNVNYYLVLSLIGQGQARAAFLISIPQLIIMLSGSLFLLPLIEGLGAAIALVVAAIAGNIFACYYLTNSDRSLLTNLSKTIAKATVPPGIMCLIAVLTKDSFYLLIILLSLTVSVLISLGSVTLNDFKKLWNEIVLHFNRWN